MRRRTWSYYAGRMIGFVVGWAVVLGLVPVVIWKSLRRKRLPPLDPSANVVIVDD